MVPDAQGGREPVKPRSRSQRFAHFSGDVDKIVADERVLFNAGKEAKGREEKAGRVIRRYRHGIPIGDFDKWQHLIRSRAQGCGLYALYAGERLVYVGLATKSIRARIQAHVRKGDIKFTHFSVFLVTGQSSKAQERRIRDLEALLLNVLRPKPKWNRLSTSFVAATKLKDH
jgi:hypothetical protein